MDPSDADNDGSLDTIWGCKTLFARVLSADRVDDLARLRGRGEPSVDTAANWLSTSHAPRPAAVVDGDRSRSSTIGIAAGRPGPVDGGDGLHRSWRTLESVGEAEYTCYWWRERRLR